MVSACAAMTLVVRMSDSSSAPRAARGPSPRGPSVLALTRQTLPQVRRAPAEGNRAAHGAYELSPAAGKARATIFASVSSVMS